MQDSDDRPDLPLPPGSEIPGNKGIAGPGATSRTRRNGRISTGDRGREFESPQPDSIRWELRFNGGVSRWRG